MLRLLALLPLLVVLASPAAAQEGPESQLPEPQRKAIQEALVWSGDYEARIDGAIGPATRSAIRSFQERNGFEPTGYLRQPELDRLLEIRNEWTDRFGWEIRRFAELGLRLGIPAAMMRAPEPMEHGVRFRSKEDRPRAELRVYSAAPMSNERFRELREELVDRDHFSRDTYDAGDDDWFVFSGTSEAGVEQYTYVVNRDNGVRGFSFRYLERDAAELSRLNVAMYNSLRTFAPEGEESAEEDEAEPEPADEAEGLFTDRELALLGDGEVEPEEARTPEPGRRSVGFLVSADGAILTTASAVDGCKRIDVNGRTEAAIRAVDREHDLALLEVPTGGREYPHLSFRSGPVTKGERLRALVYEPQDDGRRRLAVEEAEVRQLRGEQGDIRRFRYEGELRAGSRGAPLIDGSGRVAGLVDGVPEGELEDERLLPPRQQLATRSGVLEAFLGAHGVAYEAESAQETEKAIDRATRLATVRLECAR